MSKKRHSTFKFRLNHPREIGKFYKVDDSNGGHPGRIYHAEPSEDIYFVQRFSTRGRKDRVRLTHNIDPESDKEQWLIKRPSAIGFDDMTYKDEYSKYRVHPSDNKTLIKYQKYNLKKKKRCAEGAKLSSNQMRHRNDI